MADPRIKNAKGWNIIQEASLYNEEQILLDCLLTKLHLEQKEWEILLPELMNKLEALPDFHLKINWKISTWVPFASKIATLPSDTFQIYKKGKNLRVDSNMRGIKNIVIFIFYSEFKNNNNLSLL
jgi:hypothetical protein